MTLEMRKTALTRGRKSLFLFEADDILHLAIQCVTKGIQRFGADVFSLFDAVEGVGGEALLIDQVVLRYILFVERFIKRFVADHFYHHTYCNILKRLTMPNKLSIMVRR